MTEVMQPEKADSGELCGKMVSGSGLASSYRCTLMKGHEENGASDDPEPCYAVEVNRSTRVWQEWKRRQLMKVMPTHKMIEPGSECEGILFLSEDDAQTSVCDRCRKPFQVATARASAPVPASAGPDHEVQVGETVTLEGSGPTFGDYPNPFEPEHTMTNPDLGPDDIPPPGFMEAHGEHTAIDFTAAMNLMLDEVNSYKRGLTKAVNKVLDSEGEIKAGPIVKAVLEYGAQWHAERMSGP